MDASGVARRLTGLGLSPESASTAAGLHFIPARGSRSYGIADIFAWPEVFDVNSSDPAVPNANLLIVGSAMDGRFIVIDLARLVVGLIDQFDPDYPAVISETFVPLATTVDQYFAMLETDLDAVPADYEEALRRAGRRFREAD
jgi:hypothetical protein